MKPRKTSLTARARARVTVRARGTAKPQRESGQTRAAKVAKVKEQGPDRRRNTRSPLQKKRRRRKRTRSKMSRFAWKRAGR